MHLQPYLYFDGKCDQAIEFYKIALGAKVEFLMRFKDNPEAPPPGLPPGFENKVMHATLRIGETAINASDGHCGGKPTFAGISLALTVADDAEAERIFSGLCDGGTVNMPLAKTFFSSRFGMVTDRFGVSWLVIVQHGDQVK